jgi:murein DD-endopeptidase MepM/ murein hydrolase activator NlpD
MRFDINILAERRIRFYIVFAVILAGTAFFCESLFADDETIHVLKSGETIYGLAREYDVKVEEILFLNGIDDARKVQSGQRIRIPATSAMVPPINPDPNAPAVVLHRVQKGETLFGISRQYSVSIADIRIINNLPENYGLKSGDVLKIPVVPANSGKTAIAAQPALNAPAANNRTAPSFAREVNLSLVWPINPKQAGYMTGKLSGVVMVGEHGEGVYCVFPGTVISAGPYRGFGRVVIVRSAEGYLYVYGGCETLFVKSGDAVRTGMELGRLGIDSVSGQAALFFMVYLNNTPVDPASAPRG